MSITISCANNIWQVELQAKRAGMASIRVLHFEQKLFPGYRHVTTEVS